MGTTKQYRARTGCLTCRDRHIKCDEASPRCRNCAKSDRVCERGIRLNFIDIQTTASQPLTKLPPGTQLVFQDESRIIASGYTVGSDNPKLARAEGRESPRLESSLPGSPGLIESAGESRQQDRVLAKSLVPSSRLVTSLDEGLLMEVFVEKVGPWIDCLNDSKPFTNIASFYSLSQPMLYNAIMACAAKYLMPTEASLYQHRAAQDLHSQLVDPNYDPLLCVVTAALLDICEVIGDGIGHSHSHTGSTSALIQRSNFNGRNAGLAGACFWSNILTSLIHSLYHNEPLTWDPASLGVEMDSNLASSGELAGDEDKWTHRIIYISARIASLRADLSDNTHDYSVNHLHSKWEQYKAWCDDWANSVPRSMMPLCYVPPSEANPITFFPHVLLVKPSATISRLLYHISCLLLAKIHPEERSFKVYAQRMQTRHALDICGIASQAVDKEVTYTAIYCLLIAAECLVEAEAREEALKILDKITRGTPWNVDHLRRDIEYRFRQHNST